MSTRLGISPDFDEQPPTYTLSLRSVTPKPASLDGECTVNALQYIDISLLALFRPSDIRRRTVWIAGYKRFVWLQRSREDRPPLLHIATFPVGDAPGDALDEDISPIIKLPSEIPSHLLEMVEFDDLNGRLFIYCSNNVLYVVDLV